MVRRTRRYYRRRPYKTVKYSNETSSISDDVSVPVIGKDKPLTTVNSLLAINSNIQGMRKVKNFTLHIDTNCPVPLYFALIYVPQGTSPGNINVGTVQNPVSFYEPNQNVILSGICRTESPQLTFRSRLARNLNSGDSIAIIFRPAAKAPTSDEDTDDRGEPTGYATYLLTCTLNYAITF